MLDTTALVHSIASPPALSHDTPTASDNLHVINHFTEDGVGYLETASDIENFNSADATRSFFQDSEDLTDEDDDLVEARERYFDGEDDTVD